jgi:6-phosphofructokinase 1
MPDLVKGNAAIGQSGGPTAVINQSLVGVVEGLRATLVKKKLVKKIYGMRHGVNGLTKSPAALVDLTKTPTGILNALANTPSAALGSSRDKPDADYCARIMESCKANDIRYFFYIGGNDSSDTCRIVNELAAKAGYELRCFHVPKTVDNDLMGNDHTPGYPSAARFVATAFAADALDNASLPGVKINVVMGRHAGFLTAAAALARTCFPKAPKGYEPGPHLVYVPEVPFDTDRFIADVESVYARLGRCQIAVSEGISNAQGKAIATTLMPTGDVDAHGNVQLSGTGALGDALSELIKKRVKRADGKAVRVRADTFGYLQRCWPDASPVDQKEARAAGAFAAKLAAGGTHLSGSVAIVRVKNKPYKVEYRRQELTDVAAKTRHLPPEFIDGTSNVSKKFIEYALPLVGKLPVMGAL